MPTLSDRLARGELILIDGATGTDLERRGVPMVEHAWCGDSARTHPDDLRAVHLAHIEAGAELIIANTYASSRHVLEQAGVDEHFELLNRRGIEVAIEAREVSGRSEVVVAGSISTTQQGFDLPPLEVARANYLEQAHIQAEAGADMIILEMMRDIEHTQAAVDAALSVGLPIWLGISCVVEDGVPWMFNKTVTVADFLPTIDPKSIELLAVMHTETAEIDACLDVIDDGWDGPVGVYAQSGEFDPPVWVFIDVISDADYAEACMRWIERGVQVIGGCCGIGHEHISHLRPLIDAARSTRS